MAVFDLTSKVIITVEIDQKYWVYEDSMSYLDCLDYFGK